MSEVTVPSQSWSVNGQSSSEQRDGLIRFWLAAPLDQLEALWNSHYGQLTQQLVRELSPEHVFSTEEVALRNAIGQQLHQGGLTQPLAVQLMLANFLLSPPGLLTINNVEQFFPTWLAVTYKNLYTTEKATPASAQVQPVGQLPEPPDFGPFPATLQELSANRIHLNRLLGLSNLYYIDPEDHDIRDELVDLRRDLVTAIERCPEQELEHLWASELGERYWALVRSGIQREALSTEDEAQKQKAVTSLNPQAGGGFGTPGALNAFLIVMAYLAPGTMKVDDAERKIPAWLLSSYQEIFAKALPS